MIPKKHDATYSKIIGSKRWKRLRAEHLSRHPLCEICESKDITRPAEEVHHIIPISTSETAAGKRRLAYDPANLMSLCADCHKAVHAYTNPFRGLTRAKVREYAHASAERFLGRYIKPSRNF